MRWEEPDLFLQALQLVKSVKQKKRFIANLLKCHLQVNEEKQREILRKIGSTAAGDTSKGDQEQQQEPNFLQPSNVVLMI
ncbi:unnamed protein product, partial [Amoebophrya sp. A120]